MDLISEPLPGVKVLRPVIFEDNRGCFVKTFHEGQLAAFGIHFSIREEFFSTSAENVLRGMHFQLPPHAHQKLIYCIQGRVMDVLLDIRKMSKTFGKVATINLSSTNQHLVYVPIGVAHGFLSLENGSSLVYKTDSAHVPNYDTGIRWNSFGFYCGVADPIVSARDAAFPAMVDFSTPFVDFQNPLSHFRTP